MKIWNVVEWRNAGHDVNAINMYLKYSKEFSKYNFAVVDFVKPERVWMEYAAGDPSEYVTLEGANFEPDSSSMMDYMAHYNGKTVYVVFEKTFTSPSDVCVPAEKKYVCSGTPLYVIE